jgi:hypothetical protein
MNLQEQIRRILKEESLKQTLIDEIKTQGWFNVSQYVGGDENLKKITEIHNSRQFMKLFSDLTKKQSEEHSNAILYKNKIGMNIFIHREFSKNTYFNEDLVYGPLAVFLETRFIGDRDNFLKEWVRKNYDLNVSHKNIDYYSTDFDQDLVYLN